LEHLQVVEDLKASSRFQRDAVQLEIMLRLRAMLDHTYRFLLRSWVYLSAGRCNGGGSEFVKL
jgi:hypothetical protein